MLSVQTKDNPQFLINFLLCLSNKGNSLLHVTCRDKKEKQIKLTKTGKPANISIGCLRLLCLNPLFELF